MPTLMQVCLKKWISLVLGYPLPRKIDKALTWLSRSISKWAKDFSSSLVFLLPEFGSEKQARDSCLEEIRGYLALPQGYRFLIWFGSRERRREFTLVVWALSGQSITPWLAAAAAPEKKITRTEQEKQCRLHLRLSSP
ncbi:hypothetical protein MRB53_014323 [Persea americana]|uniref:Uncharacterized protein n=1 Tax=Persea americana TaxID=3435 RepID=A0ACC2KB07_PERAE|nr:hypothetical protein MRB53_014323 [Persea americana]